MNKATQNSFCGEVEKGVEKEIGHPANKVSTMSGDCLCASGHLALFPHQQDIINVAQGKQAFAILADMGTGKTRCAIELIRDLRNQTCMPYPITLIIAPATILENWLAEIKQWSNLCAVVLQGTKAKRLRLLNEQVDVYIINYEALRLLEPELLAKQFNMIIADESQKLKGYKTLQSKAAFRIAQKAQYRLIMTGTPIQNNYLDIFGQYRFLNPFIFGFSYYKFRNRYALMGGYGNFSIKQWINIDELKEKVYSCAIRINKADCLNLPEKIYEVHCVELTDEQKRVYNELRKEFISELKGKIVTAPYILTRLLRLSQCTAGFCKAEDREEINFSVNPKLKLLKEIIEDLPKDEKVIVFFRFIKELRNLQTMFTEMGLKYVEVYGETKNRQEQVNIFNNGDARIFIGQLATAGLGLNLRAAYCIFLSNSYSYGDRLQCEDRTHGIGRGDKSGRSTVYLDIICRDTIDVAILECLKNKSDLAQYILTNIKNNDTI